MSCMGGHRRRTCWVMAALSLAMLRAVAVAQRTPAEAAQSFEAATIKPSAPGQSGRALGWDGRRFTAHYTTISQMMQFAYGVQAKQILGEPGWFDAETFDIDGVTETGEPTPAEWKVMMQHLLAERLQMQVHDEPRVMPAYALTVAKGGPKLESPKDVVNMTNGVRIMRGPHLFLRVVSVRGTMPELAAELQRVEMDRPVVDQTGLPGQFNFTLTATSIKPFFAGEMPPTGEDAPAELFTAIRDQLGLRLEPMKTAVECIVIDHVERPSAN